MNIKRISQRSRFPESQKDKKRGYCEIKNCYFRLALTSMGEVWFDDASVVANGFRAA